MAEKQNQKRNGTLNRSIIKRYIKTAKLSFDNKFQELREKEEISYNDIQLLYRTIWDFMIKLKKKYSFTYCRLFDNLPFISDTLFSKELFEIDDGFLIGKCPYEYSSGQDKLCPNFKRIKKNLTSPIFSSFECLNSLNENDQKKALQCFTVDGQYLSGKNEVVLVCSNLAVIIGIDEEIERLLEIDDLLFKEIGLAFFNICEKLQDLSTMFLKQKYYGMLSIFRHECSHYASRIKNRNEEYHNRSRYESLPLESRENIYRDINSVATNLQLISDNVNIILHDDVPRNLLKQGSLCLNDEINKWVAMYRLELKENDKEIRKRTSQYDYYRTFNTSPNLFSMMLFNIMNNAIKYSFYGTAIEVELKPEGPRAQDFELVITDYGLPIDLSDHPYELFYRSPLVADRYIGDGVGLFVCKHICRSLGLTISHTCEKISDFNFPLLRAIRIRNYDLEKMVGSEKYAMLCYAEKKYSSILSQNTVASARLTKAKAFEHIELPVYKVSFVIKGLKEWS